MTFNIDDNQKAQIIAFKEILSFREALLYIDISSSLLYKLVSKKAIRYTKPNNGRLYFKKADLDNWMMQNQSESINDLSEDIFNHLKKRQ